ncbi:glycoside hydrolase family 31 protein [Luteimicrobium xylanilyticum]|uniref:Alpha-glucosidase n=1 Tax=Luteimicrobium xylanilyticum TaxID=1133546 RepID=A0A5P9QFW8_9MICO|nr:TIM-barrel domain-containing protein [Luteimicrobium xylanilyticum]QFU99972.1 Alpha-glucosidase [Luteimicrobium xylanilyticum]
MPDDARSLPALATDPVADPHAVVQGDRYRITVLTDGLVRLEYAEDGVFEDRASTFAVRRRLPVPAFRVLDDGPNLEVVTDRFRLVYDRRPFSTSGLSVAVRGGVTVYHSVWRYGEELGDADGTVAGMPGLRGTARTLDEADGAIPLEPGVVSRTGFAVLDDSASMLFTDDGWVAPRGGDRAGAGAASSGRREDLYVFAYGTDHAEALRAFYAVSGPQPLLPRFALGNWWSRYHPYTAASYEALIERFAAEGLPFSVSVVDMDWHVVDVDPELGSGWTGYTWNRSLFPDPAKFLAWLHERGLRVTLNVHPADGVRAHEEAYAAMAAALSRDTSQRDPIAFDVTDRAFLEAYFAVLHRRLERDGVDFWWLDWQSGPHSRVAGIDPLWTLNHFHFLDNARPREAARTADGRAVRDDRPLTFSRYAGPGSHRYPVGFSGDAVISWASLDFQPYFTASAANIGYGWWSHDIGGHFHGAKDDELATRWFQLGVLSPIMRLHSGANAFITKEPWSFGAEAREVMTAFLRLRHRLVPYLHAMNHRAAFEATPLVRPLYHRWPRPAGTYDARNTFLFGSELLVAPITSPADGATRLGEVRTWLPAGTWVDVLGGNVYAAHDAGSGGREIVLHRPLASVPVLAPAGAVVPLDAAAVPGNDTAPPEALEVLVVVGADGAFDLIEDDGGPVAGPDAPNVARTPVRWVQAEGRAVVGPVRGGSDGTAAVPARRTWTLTFPSLRGLGPDERAVVTVTVDGAPAEADVRRVSLAADPRGTALAVTVADVPADVEVVVRLGAGTALDAGDLAGRVFDLLDRAQIGYDLKERLLAVATADEPVTARISRLQALGLERPLESALGELLLAR